MAFLSDKQVQIIQKTLVKLFYKKNFVSENQRNRFIGVLPQALKQQDLKYFQQPIEDLGDFTEKQDIVDELFHHWQSSRSSDLRTSHSSKLRVISAVEHWYIQTKKQVPSVEKLLFSLDLLRFDENVSCANITLYPELLLHIVQP